MNDAEMISYLRENGYPEHVVKGGRRGLVDRWNKFVEDVSKGYKLGLEDYRNDLDVRGILRLAGGEDAAIAQLDERLRKLLTGAGRVWESAPGDPFWDFGYPRNAGTELMSGLREEGLV